MWFLSIRNSFQFFHLWCSSRIPPTIPRDLVVGRGRQNLRTSSICCPSTRRCTVTQVGFGTLLGGDTAQYGYAEFGAFENPMVYFQQNDPMKWETPLWLKGRAPRLQNWLVNCKVERKSERIQSLSSVIMRYIPSNSGVSDLRLLCLLISKSKHCWVQKSFSPNPRVPITSVPSKEMVVVWCSLCKEGILLFGGLQLVRF